MKNKGKKLLTIGVSAMMVGAVFASAIVLGNHFKEEEPILEGSYVEGKVMVKVFTENQETQDETQLQLRKAAESISKDSILSKLTSESLTFESQDGTYAWYEYDLKDNVNINDAINKLSANKEVICAEPIYYRTAQSGETEGYGQSSPLPHDDIGIDDARNFLKKNGINEGGSSDVVVAVLDTGVDYTHPALKNNMWINTGEIPNNGIDDDGNGYVDDVYGANVLGSSFDKTGDPMDVNGHGTHVAGIIAANSKEVTGIANNVKIMAICAGQPSGTFTTQDIVEGITYAYTMGADVLNMSFGGYTRSQLEYDALQRAYNTTVLVAAAGNDTLPNIPCPYGANSYPGAFPFVVGVMSHDSSSNSGQPTYLSRFSNVDYLPLDRNEYEVSAPGNGIMSTLPNNKYASWSGTSMASPVVAAAAALLRSYYTDKVEYTSRFIMGQLVSTGEENVYPIPNVHSTYHNSFRRLNVYNALTVMPQPEIVSNEFFIDDSPEIDPANDGDGALDSGETVHLGLSLKNRWGKSCNTVVKIDNVSGGGVADPYIEWIKDTNNYGDVGAWEDVNNWVYDKDSVITGIQPGYEFIFKVKDNCPNDIMHAFNVVITCNNGMDKEDKTDYLFNTEYYQRKYNVTECVFTITSRKGRELPTYIDEDMTLTPDYYWIIPSVTTVKEGVTLTIEAGTEVQFYSSENVDVYADPSVAKLNVRGTLITKGTAENPVKFFPSGFHDELVVNVHTLGSGVIDLNYTEIMNPNVYATDIDSCYFYQDVQQTYTKEVTDSEGQVNYYYAAVHVSANTIKDSIFYNLGMLYFPYYQFQISAKTLDCCLFNKNYMTINYYNFNEVTDCVFLNNTNENEHGELLGSSVSQVNSSGDSTIRKVVQRPETGTVYIDIATESYDKAMRFAKYLGGYIVAVNDADEHQWLRQNFSDWYPVGIEYDVKTNKLILSDGTIATYHCFDEYTNYKNARFGRVSSLNSSNWDIGYYGFNRFVLEIPQDGIVNNISLDSSITIDNVTVGYSPIINVYPEGASKDDLVYSSSDETVFTVDKEGKINGVGLGTAELKVSTKDGYVTATSTVKVIEKIALENISIAETDIAIEEGDNYQIAPIYTPSNTTQKSVRFVSHDENVATVSTSGLVTGKGIGKTIIDIYDANNKLQASLNVDVQILAKSIDVDSTLHFTYKGDAFDIAASVLPTDTSKFELEYLSSNEDIATVDSNGHVEVKSKGYAIVRVSDKLTGIYTDVIINSFENPTNEPVIQEITMGNYYYALDAEGNVYYWGSGNTAVKKVTKITEVTNVAHIYSHGSSKVYLLTKDGSLYFKDYDNFKKVNLNGKVANVFPTPNRVFIELEDGSIYAFGEGNYGALGTGSNDWVDYSAPKLVFDTEGVKNIEGTYYLTFLLTDSNTLYMTGNNDNTVFKPVSADFEVADLLNLTSESWSYCPVVKTSTNTFMGFNRESGTFTECYKLNNVFDLDKSKSKINIYQNADYFAYVDKNGYARFSGYNNNSKFGSKVNADSWIDVGSDVLPYGNIKVKDALMNEYNTMILTEEGKVLMLGSAANGRLGNSTTSAAKTPVEIGFNIQYPDSLAVVDCNLSLIATNANVASNQAITIRFNQGIVQSAGFKNIKVTDRANNKANIVASSNINSITIKPSGNWGANTLYTVTIPANSILNYFGESNEQITLTFTVNNVLVDSIKYAGEIVIDDNTKDFLPSMNYSPLNADLSTLNYSSTDKKVFTVDGSGRITATGIGSAQLIATSDDGYIREVVSVTVYEYIAMTELNISKDSFNMFMGDTALIEYTKAPSNTTESIMFSSSNTDVVVVSSGGLITTVGTGDAVVTVKNSSGSKVKNIPVRVDSKVETLEADSIIYGTVGTTSKINLTISPANATICNFEYQIDNTSYATVDNEGNISFLKAGTATLRVKETNSNLKVDVLISISNATYVETSILKVANSNGTSYYALDTKGNLWSWANNISIPKIIATNVKDIASNGNYNDELEILYNDGSLGRASGSNIMMIGYVQRPDNIISMWVVSGKTYVLTSDNMLYAKGNNGYCSLGTGNIDSGNYTNQFEECGYFDNIKDIFGNYYTTYILTTDGKLYYAGSENRECSFDELKLSIDVKGYISSDSSWNDTYLVSTSNKVYGLTNNLTLYSRDGTYPENFVSAAMYDDSIAYILEDKTIQVYGNNSNHKFGDASNIGSFVSVSDNVKIPGISNAKQVLVNQFNTFILTEDNQLYMVGSNSNKRLGSFVGKYSDVPVKVNFQDIALRNISLISSTLDATTSNVPVDQVLEFVFDQKVEAGNSYNMIRVMTRNNEAVSFKKTIDFNKLTITPTDGWKSGVVYNIYIPANALTNGYSKYLTTDYNQSFTTGDTPISSMYFVNPILNIDTITTDYFCGLSYYPLNADIHNLIWTSSDESVFRVDNEGKITGVGQGSATLTVKTPDNFCMASLTVNVTEYVALESLTIGKNAFSLELDGKAIIEYNKYPSNATPVLTITSSNPAVASVTNAGQITAVGIGEAIITVSCGTISHQITVNVTSPIKEINGSGLITGAVGSVVSLEYSYLPADATTKDIEYIVDDNSVASVSSDGNVALLKEGSATVRIVDRVSGLYLDCIVSVLENNQNTRIEKVISLNYNLNIALDENGILYLWGSKNKVPTVLDTDVIDLAKCASNYFFYLKNDGTLIRYYYSENTFNKEDSYTISGAKKLFDGYEMIGIVDNNEGLYVCRYDLKFIGYFETVVKSFASCYEYGYALLENGKLYRLTKEGTSNQINDLGIDIKGIYGVDKGYSEIFILSSTNTLYRYDNSKNLWKMSDSVQPNNEVSNLFFYESETYCAVMSDGSVRFVGSNSNNRFGLKDNNWYSFNEGITNDSLKNIQFVDISDSHSFFIDDDGKLYGLGSCKNNCFSLSTNSDVINKKAVEIKLINVEEKELSVVSISEITAVNDKILIKFNKAISVGDVFNTIRVQTRTQKVVPALKTIDFDTLIISPTNGWDDGVVYQVIVPQGSLKTALGNENKELNKTFSIGSVPVESLSFSSNSIDIDTRAVDYDLGPNIKPINADVSSLIWSSSNPTVVSVNNGKISGLKEGTAVITVKSVDEFISKSINVNVKEYIKLNDLILDTTSYSIKVGDQRNVSIIKSPSNATEALVYTSSDENIVKVNNSGKMTGMSIGTATITVSNQEGTVTKTIDVRVDAYIEEITFENEIVSLKYEQNLVYQLDFKTKPTAYSNANFKFRTSNEDVATVNDNGLVSIKEVGLVTIRVLDEVSGVSSDVILSISENEQESIVIKDISVGNECTYMLDSNGNVWYLGQNMVTPKKCTIGNVKFIGSARYNGAVIVTKDNVIYKVDRDYSEKLMNFDQEVTSLFVSGEGSYFIYLANNDLYAFGYNNSGELGLNPSSYVNRPQFVENYEGIKNIVGKYNNSVILFTDGTVSIAGSYSGKSGFVKNNLIKNVTKVVSSSSNLIYFLSGVTTSRFEGDSLYVEERNSDILENYVDMYSTSANGSSVRLFKISSNELVLNGYNTNNYNLGAENPSSWYYGKTNIKTFPYGIVNATSSEHNTYVLLEDGSVYGFGLGKYLGLGASGVQLDAHKIQFNLAENSSLEVINKTSSIDKQSVNAKIYVEFNQQVYESQNIYSSYVMDSKGNYVAVKCYVDLNRFVFEPASSWKEGETYSVYVYDNSVKSVSSESNATIAFNFTVETGGNAINNNINANAVSGSKSGTRVIADKDKVTQMLNEYVEGGYDSKFYNNAFLNDFSYADATKWMRFVAQRNNSENDSIVHIAYNYWGTTNKTVVEKQIWDFDDFSEFYDIDPYPILEDGVESMYPFATKIEIMDLEGNIIEHPVKGMKNKIRIYFNRDMNPNIDLNVYFGPDEPFTDWKCNGGYISSRCWEGELELSTLAGAGVMHLFIVDGAAADNDWLRLFKDLHFTFTAVDADGAMSLDLAAAGAEGKVVLNWQQDDFETLAGYNVYRSSDGINFARINSTTVTEKTYEDYNVAPGVTYWYKFTVVQTDFTESGDSNIVNAAALDTVPPTISHKPVTSSAGGDDVYIYANIYDNIQVIDATLHYSVNGGEYKTVTMNYNTNTNSQYNYVGIVPGADLKTTGYFNYYISAYDGVTNAYSGSSSQPYYVEITKKVKISSISKNEGDIAGGDEITIKGENFATGVQVKFGNIYATNVVLVDSSTITCKVPACSIPSTVNIVVTNRDKTYGIMVSGYTYTSDKVSVEIPDVKCGVNSTVCVPVNLINVKGLVSVDLDFNYNTSLLKFTGISQGSIGKTFTADSNDNNGHVKVAMAGSTSLSGTGAIIYLEFTSYLNIGNNTQLTVNELKLNGGAISFEKKVGYLIGTDTFYIGGYVYYYSNSQGMSNVTVKLTGDNQYVYTLNSQSSGKYSFSGISEATYNVQFSKNDDVNGITAYDAALILKAAVNKTTLSANQQIAADVNNSGNVDSYDAHLILDYCVGASELPFAGRESIWEFTKSRIDAGRVESNTNLSNVYAILVGDVSGDYKQSSSSLSLVQNPYTAIQVGSPTIDFEKSEISLPIYVKNAGTEVFSVEFAINYTKELTLKSLDCNANGLTVYNAKEGRAKIATASADSLLEKDFAYTLTFSFSYVDKVSFTLTNANVNERYDISLYNNMLVFGNGFATAQEVMAFIGNTYDNFDISRYDLNHDGIIDIYDVILASR